MSLLPPAFPPMHTTNTNISLLLLLCVVALASVGSVAETVTLQFLPWALYSSDPSISVADIAIGDFNSDGFPDLVYTGFPLTRQFDLFLCKLVLLLNTGDGTLEPSVNILFNCSTEVTPRSVTTADINNDGKLDVIVGSDYQWCDDYFMDDCHSYLAILLGNGDGTFQNRLLVATDHSNVHVTVADLNVDGNADILTDDSNSGITLLLGDGRGTFQRAGVWVAGGQHSHLADMSGDGRIDIVSFLRLSYASIEWKKNYETDMRGNVTLDLLWTPLASLPAVATYPDAELALGDINHDGHVDVVATRARTDVYDPIFVFKNIGNAMLVAFPSVSINYTPSAPVLADVDGDGNLDIVCTQWYLIQELDYGKLVSVYLGYGNGSFETTPISSLPTLYTSPLRPVVGDLNRDGLADLVVTNGTGIHVALQPFRSGVRIGEWSVSPPRGPIYIAQSVTFLLSGVAIVTAVRAAPMPLQSGTAVFNFGTAPGSPVACDESSSGTLVIPVQANTTTVSCTIHFTTSGTWTPIVTITTSTGGGYSSTSSSYPTSVLVTVPAATSTTHPATTPQLVTTTKATATTTTPSTTAAQTPMPPTTAPTATIATTVQEFPATDTPAAVGTSSSSSTTSLLTPSASTPLATEPNPNTTAITTAPPTTKTCKQFTLNSIPSEVPRVYLEIHLFVCIPREARDALLRLLESVSNLCISTLFEWKYDKAASCTSGSNKRQLATSNSTLSVMRIGSHNNEPEASADLQSVLRVVETQPAQYPSIRIISLQQRKQHHSVVVAGWLIALITVAVAMLVVLLVAVVISVPEFKRRATKKKHNADFQLML